MIKHAGGEDTGCMASTTIIGGGHVVWRLTNCVNAVMAGCTQLVCDAGDSVIETLRPGEGTSIVAHAAVGGRCGVIRRFTQ